MTAKILLPLLLLVSMAAAPLRAADFLLFYSNDLRGETEPCGCRSRQLGGLARQALQLSELSAKEQLPFLFLSGGGLLFRHEAMQDGQEQQELIRAEGVAAAMRTMGCQASGIEAHDLAGGVELLRRFQAEGHLTWLSMNLAEAKSGSLIFAPSLLTETAGLRVALLGLTGSLDNAPDKERHVLLPWQETLPKELARLKGKAEMIILLSSLPAKINMEIAEARPEISLILTSAAAASAHPFLVHETLFAQTGARGKNLGTMRISWTAAGKWAQDGFREINQTQERLDYVNVLLGRLERRGERKDQAGEKDRLLTEKQQLEEKLALLREKIKTADENSCRFRNQFVALESSLPEDPKVREIIADMTSRINMLNRERQEEAGRVLVLSVLSGWQRCVKCHPAQAAFWEQTAHARSVQTLKKRAQQFNEDCLICHVTLPHYDPAKIKAERLILQLPERLRNVGCEVCHGPSAAHAASPEKVRTPNPKPDEQVCLGCHTPEHDGSFIFAEKEARVRCPKP
jgi:2',3'-cyclic-nucleotide 2'-phosphodiesterase (5'-nucleotidase family)